MAISGPELAAVFGMGKMCQAIDGLINSSEPGPRVVARMTRGRVVGTLIWPQWTPAPLWQRWAGTAY